MAAAAGVWFRAIPGGRGPPRGMKVGIVAGRAPGAELEKKRGR